MTPYLLLVAPFVEFDFMRRALVGSLALSLGAGPLGVFLMLRRMSLAGDAMSHAILPGVAVGFLVAGLSLPAMTLGGVAAGVIVAVLSGLVSRATVLREDTSLAAIYLVSLALGVLLISLRGSAIDLFHILFGTVLALDDGTMLLLAGVATLTLTLLAIFYRPLVLECVDPGFLAQVSRLGPVVHLGFLALVVLNLVAGFQALGTLLAVGLMILPAAAARFHCDSVAWMPATAAAIACLSGLAGLIISFHADVPGGPAIILVAGFLYVSSMLIGRRGVVWRLLPRRHLEA